MLEDGQQLHVLAERVEAALTRQRRPAASPRSAARRRHSAPPIERPTARLRRSRRRACRTAASTVATQSAQVLVLSPATRAVTGQQRHLDGVATRRKVLGPRAHRGGVAGEPVLDQHADARPPVSRAAPPWTSGRRPGSGCEGSRTCRRGRGSSRRTVCTSRAAVGPERRVAGWSRYERRERGNHAPGTVAPVSRPDDESRTESAWREIVENYGEHAPTTAAPSDEANPSLLALPQPEPASDDLPEHRGRRADGAAERPSPRSSASGRRRPRRSRCPRTGSAALAWAGIFVAPAARTADRSLLALRPPRWSAGCSCAGSSAGSATSSCEMPRRPATPGTTAHASEPPAAPTRYRRRVSGGGQARRSRSRGT